MSINPISCFVCYVLFFDKCKKKIQIYIYIIIIISNTFYQYYFNIYFIRIKHVFIKPIS